MGHMGYTRAEEEGVWVGMLGSDGERVGGPEGSERREPCAMSTGGSRALSGWNTQTSLVWVEYPDKPQLYKVARNLPFPSPEAAHEHLERIRKPKAKAASPLPQPSDQAELKTNALTDLKTNSKTNPKTNPMTNHKLENNPNSNPTPHPTHQLWDPKMGPWKCENTSHFNTWNTTKTGHDGHKWYPNG